MLSRYRFQYIFSFLGCLLSSGLYRLGNVRDRVFIPCCSFGPKVKNEIKKRMRCKSEMIRKKTRGKKILLSSLFVCMCFKRTLNLGIKNVFQPTYYTRLRDNYFMQFWFLPTLLNICIAPTIIAIPRIIRYIEFRLHNMMHRWATDY